MVDAFAATLPGLLPDDYRAFLLATNGGVPEANWRPPELGGDGMGVAGFMSLGDVESYDSLVQSRALFTGRIPGHLLAVADNDGDAQVCISLAGGDRSRVWLFDSEREFDPEEVQDADFWSSWPDRSEGFRRPRASADLRGTDPYARGFEVRGLAYLDDRIAEADQATWLGEVEKGHRQRGRRGTEAGPVGTLVPARGQN